MSIEQAQLSALVAVAAAKLSAALVATDHKTAVAAIDAALTVIRAKVAS